MIINASNNELPSPNFSSALMPPPINESGYQASCEYLRDFTDCSLDSRSDTVDNVKFMPSTSYNQSVSDGKVITDLEMDEMKKHNHSEIEKRRRDRMNHYIIKLSKMIPLFGLSSRKLDKLSVLRMTLKHIRSIQSQTEANKCLALTTDEDYAKIGNEILYKFLAQSTEYCLLAVDCETMKVILVSPSLMTILNYTQKTLINHCWTNYLHPMDVNHVKEQLMYPSISGQHLKDQQLCPGLHRKFFFRMKVNHQTNEFQSLNSKVTSIANEYQNAEFQSFHFAGYLKAIPVKSSSTAESGSSADDPNMTITCLIGIAKPLRTVLNDSLMIDQVIDFHARINQDGKFCFIEQCATSLVGYLPQQIVGTSLFDYCHVEDMEILTDLLNKAKSQLSREYSATKVFRFRTESARWIKLETSWLPIRNSFSQNLEYIITRNIYRETADKTPVNQFRLSHAEKVCQPVTKLDDKATDLDLLFYKLDENSSSDHSLSDICIPSICNTTDLEMASECKDTSNQLDDFRTASISAHRWSMPSSCNSSSLSSVDGPINSLSPNISRGSQHSSPSLRNLSLNSSNSSTSELPSMKESDPTLINYCLLLSSLANDDQDERNIITDASTGLLPFCDTSKLTNGSYEKTSVDDKYFEPHESGSSRCSEVKENAETNHTPVFQTEKTIDHQEMNNVIGQENEETAMALLMSLLPNDEDLNELK